MSDKERQVDIEKTRNDNTESCTGQQENNGSNYTDEELAGVIDWVDVSSRLGTDQDLILVIASDFYEDNRKRIQILGEMIKQKETGPIRELAHAIKGSAATIGARKLSDAAKELQYAADLEKVGEYQELFQKINSEFDRFEVLYSRQNWINIIKSNT